MLGEVITFILIALIWFLNGILVGTIRVKKLYEETMDAQQEVIGKQKRALEQQVDNNVAILKENIKLSNIITNIQKMSDYASCEHIKQYIKKELTHDSQSKS